MNESTRGEIPGTDLLGRPFKPLALGMILGTSVLSADFLLNIFREPILTAQTPYAGFFGLFAITGMVLGWGIRSQKIYEISLLLIMGIWISRSVELTMIVSLADGLLPFALAFMAGGAYWLEKVSINRKVV